MGRHLGAWIRYGEPLTPPQIAFAIDHYGVAILQPWEIDAARQLKSARPDMTVLCYKCLSSSRSYETGPMFTSGVCHAEAEESGEHWFAHRASGERIEWRGYPGHWQMAVWEADYRERWVGNVADDLAESPFDGVFADNDVFDDYYGLEPPLDDGRHLSEVREALSTLIDEAGQELRRMGKLLVPNIAESRREPGRWVRHAAYGGGFEEMWLGYEPETYFDPPTALAQMEELRGPGISIMRVATDGSAGHPNFLYGLAALWVFGGGDTAMLSGTGHDDYSGTPYIPELDWDLGEPVEEPRQRGNGWSRCFSHGWAAVNLNDRRRRKVTFAVPEGGLHDRHGEAAPPSVTLSPHRGVVYRSLR